MPKLEIKQIFIPNSENFAFGNKFPLF